MLAPEPTLRPVPQLEVDTVESSCRGMAGGFRYEEAMATGGPNLPPAVQAADRNALIVAGGTRCRHRIADESTRRARHAVIVLEQALP